MELAICDCCLLLFMEYIDRMTRNLTKLQGGLQQVLPSHNHTNPFAHQASRTPSSHDCPGSQNQRDRLSRLELFRLRGATLPEPITSSRCDKLLRQSFWCLKLSHVFPRDAHAQASIKFLNLDIDFSGEPMVPLYLRNTMHLQKTHSPCSQPFN